MSFETFIKSQFYLRKSPNLIKLGFEFTQQPLQEYLKIQSMLYSEYHIKCESMLTIMKHFDIPSTRTMDILFREFDIESRSFSEATSNAIFTKRKIPNVAGYQSIYHTTWKNDIVYLRSSYEEDFAKLLDKSKIEYQVESLRIKYFDLTEQKYKIAIPDFYLPKTHTIVEVKSTYWLSNDNMKDKQKAYLNAGYRFNLYLDHILITDW
jgi:hypothetical protein